MESGLLNTFLIAKSEYKKTVEKRKAKNYIVYCPVTIEETGGDA